MRYSQIYKKISMFRHLTEDKKIIYLYRYISLFITSVAFLFSDINHSIGKKVFVITCISISSIILNYIYLAKHQTDSIIKLMILIETIGNSILLIPSGGLGSPYVWYALNTILIASILLKRKYCWINLFIYLSCSTWITYMLFNKSSNDLIQLLKLELNLVVSSVLITAAIILLARYISSIQEERKKIMNTNKQLIKANRIVKESMGYIMELYQAVHLFSHLRDKNELIDLIIQYSKRILSTDVVVFYEIEGGKNNIHANSKDEHESILEELGVKVIEAWNSVVKASSAIEINMQDKSYLITSVKSDCMIYGVLGVEVKPQKYSYSQLDSMDQIKFLADLSSIVLEKFELEKLNARLLITEEQNRIANEIHDSVLQRLFSTSFGIYGLMKRLNKINIKEADEDLNVIRESIDHAMKELRAVIYGLSWKKNGSDNFAVDIMNYLDEIKRFNEIDISFNTIGNSELISCLQKNALYRIISEGIGNSVRHGKASNIEITLNIKDNITSLLIVDNGIGFNINEVYTSKQRGLGIKNIHNMVVSLKGKVQIKSQLGRGTTIEIAIPNDTSSIVEEKVV